MLKFIAALLCLAVVQSTANAKEKLDFWNQQRKGANGMDWHEPDAWMKAAADAGIEVVRLSTATWPSKSKDPLLGDADNFAELDRGDLEKLLHVLDLADQHGVKIVLTMFSLPGARWSQHNNDRFDYRLWNEERYQEQAISFWVELAGELKDHPALVGYNPINEPHPAREEGIDSNENGVFEDWLKRAKGTTADLNRFYSKLVPAIRNVDENTPIVLDGWMHATPTGFSFLEPVEDEAVLYSFHCYEPWNFTTYRVNDGRYSYPDSMPVGWGDETRPWTQSDLHSLLQPVVNWIETHKIPSNRIFASEFGCDRRVSGSKDYLSDLLEFIHSNNWHWAFYSFRAVDWDGMDYELGTQKLGWEYWKSVEEEGKHPESLKIRKDNPLWQVFKEKLKPE